MNIQERITWLKEQAEAVKSRFLAVPLWKRIAGGIGVLFLVVYLIWCIFVPKVKPDTSTFTETKPAVTVQKVDGPTLKVPIKVVPKDAVKKKYPQATISEGQEVIDTATIPPAENGGTTITTITTSTGEANTNFKPNASPLFAFENKNYIGGGASIGTRGTQAELYYKRDLLRVKDLHLQGKVEGIVPIDNATRTPEGKAGIYVEWRF